MYLRYGTLGNNLVNSFFKLIRLRNYHIVIFFVSERNLSGSYVEINLKVLWADLYWSRVWVF